MKIENRKRDPTCANSALEMDSELKLESRQANWEKKGFYFRDTKDIFYCTSYTQSSDFDWWNLESQ